MSETCLDHECFRRSGCVAVEGEHTRISDICSGISYSDVASSIELVPDTEHVHLPEKVEVGARPLAIDRGERTLVQVLIPFDEAVLVTNDEDAFDVIKELAETGVIASYPLMSLNLVEYMHGCRALSADQANLVCEQALVTMDPRISTQKRRRKERHAEEVVQRIALVEAQRRHR